MKITALAGGVGGAKLADGLSRSVPPGELTVIVNTGDDFDFLGLRICPDLDTVCYTLAGLSNPETGWGRKAETWNALQSLTQLGGPNWFHIGDHDLGTHLERTRRLTAGQPLTQITHAFCQSWGIHTKVLPMTDDRVATIVNTRELGVLPFQNYFVEFQCNPSVTGFQFEGIQSAKPAPGVVDALLEADVIIICPSNPWVSIGPILNLPGIEQVLQQARVVAVSPIIGGKAIKGPAAKMYSELGFQPSASAVANQYKGFLDGFIFDQIDQNLTNEIQQSGIIPYATDTIMLTAADRLRLAREVLEFSMTIPRRKSTR